MNNGVTGDSSSSSDISRNKDVNVHAETPDINPVPSSRWGLSCMDGEIKLRYNKNLCRCDGTCILMCLAALAALISYVTTPEVFEEVPILLTPDERLRLLNMLTHASGVLSAHNITHWLDFGSLLGAVRNGRIIDWDDDGAKLHTAQQQRNT